MLKVLKAGSARKLITLENVVAPSGASIGRISYETEEEGAIVKAQFPDCRRRSKSDPVGQFSVGVNSEATRLVRQHAGQDS